MEKWRKWANEWKLTILGIALVMLGYLAWGLFTISYRAEVFTWIGFFVSVLTILCFIAITKIIKMRKTPSDIRNQWFVVCVTGAFLSVLLFIRNGIFLWKEGEFSYFFVVLLWCIIFISSGVLLQSGRERTKGKVKLFFKSNIGIILLMMMTALLCIDTNFFQYKWDGLLYYLTCRDLHLDSLSSLAIYGHIAQTFGALVKVADLIIGNTSWAMLAVHLILMMVGIIFFCGILRICLSDRTQWEYVLFTAIFAWSPYLLGMVHYYSLDFICQCLLPPVIYYFMKKQWILFSFFSLLFCFTKEPAIIVYGILCASAVILDFAEDRASNWNVRVNNLFARKQYYIMIVPGILWLATYEMLGPWSAGEGGFGLDISYVLTKLKNLYVLNFNWIFTIAVIIGIIIVMWKRDYELLKKSFPVLCMQLSFTVFSCLFKTVNHPRYNDTNQVTLYLLAIIFVFSYINIKKIRVGISAILSFALAFSSFYTFDPISLLVYPVYSVGETFLIMTGDIPMGDGMIYNRQMLDMENAMDLALSPVIMEDTLICFPTINNNTYYFDGMCEVASVDAYRFNIEYWDTVMDTRVPEQGSDTVEFTVCHIGDSINWSEIQFTGNDQIDLIYMTGIGEKCYSEMKARYTLVEENEYVYNGWVVYRARFDLEL